jgi:hypothetical protein
MYIELLFSASLRYPVFFSIFRTVASHIVAVDIDLNLGSKTPDSKILDSAERPCLELDRVKTYVIFLLSSAVL